MSAADRTEKVLRDIHIMFSKAEPYPARKTDVVIDKRRMMELLKELNSCIFDIMEEHEMTVQSREAAIRQVKKQNDEQIAQAQKSAEDIYAASIMYSDRALVEIREIVRESIDELDALHEHTKKKLREEMRVIKTNQYELKSQLQDLIDTDKYLKLIDEENKRIQKEKEALEALEEEYKSIPDVNPYAAIKPEIRVNPAYIPDIEKPLTPEEIAMAERESAKEKEAARREKEAEEKKAKSGIETAGGDVAPPEPEPEPQPVVAEEAPEAALPEAPEAGESASSAEDADDFPDISEALAKAARDAIEEEEAVTGASSPQKDDQIAQTIRAASIEDADLKADQAVAALAADLDAEYFDWKEDKSGEQKEEEEPPKKRGFSLFGWGK